MAPSSSSIGAPAARQPSRKGKAAWRKNVDLAPVEAALEAARARERDGSGSAGAPLFVEDRVGDEAVGARMARARRAQKPLRSLEVLRSTSAVPPVAGRARAGVAAGATALQASGMSKKQKDKLRRSAGRAVKGPFGAVVESEQGKGKEKEAVADAEYDLWQQPSAADGKRKADESSNEWLAAAMEKSNNVRPVFVLRLLHPLTLARSAEATQGAADAGSSAPEDCACRCSRAARGPVVQPAGGGTRRAALDGRRCGGARRKTAAEGCGIQEGLEGRRRGCRL